MSFTKRLYISNISASLPNIKTSLNLATQMRKKDHLLHLDNKRCDFLKSFFVLITTLGQKFGPEQMMLQLNLNITVILRKLRHVLPSLRLVLPKDHPRHVISPKKEKKICFQFLIGQKWDFQQLQRQPKKEKFKKLSYVSRGGYSVFWSRDFEVINFTCELHL